MILKVCRGVKGTSFLILENFLLARELLVGEVLQVKLGSAWLGFVLNLAAGPGGVVHYLSVNLGKQPAGLPLGGYLVTVITVFFVIIVFTMGLPELFLKSTLNI